MNTRGGSGLAAARLAAAGLALAAVLLPGTVLAHPLGNFTINHYSGVRVASDRVVVDHVIDMAEIPSFSAFAEVDRDHDGAASEAERAAAAGTRCGSQAAALDMRVAGERLPLASTGAALSFRAGQGALTMRLVCRLQTALPSSVAGSGLGMTLTDPTFAERAGWREIVVEGDGVSISASDALTSSLSARLTAYPEGLLEQPADQRGTAFTVSAGGPALPPLVQPEVDGRGSGQGEPLGLDEPPPAAVPGGSGELGGELAALFQAAELTPAILVLSLAAAAGLGALHALSPGHGKTVMAAYLVGSRGTARQALGLGLTVTVSHTLGVLGLGLLSLSAAALIPPERLYPILGMVSGVIVVSIGAWLVLGYVRGWLRVRGERAAHDHLHALDQAHDENRASGLPSDDGHRGLDHDPAPHEDGRPHAHIHVDAARGTPEHPAPHHVLRPEVPAAEGWHSHGGVRHTHLPVAGATLSRRGLFALGLAGGLVPSVSAIILLLGSIAAGRPAYGIALTVAFGVGMAAVLVGIGLVLVRARGLLERMPSRSLGASLGRLVPATSAVLVLAAGIVITVQSLTAVR